MLFISAMQWRRFSCLALVLISGMLIPSAVFAGARLMWGAGGVPVCSAVNNRYLNAVVSDGAGGAILTWSDLRGATSYDIYAARVTSDGSLPWTADGQLVCGETNWQWNSMAMAEGGGGAFLAWQDRRDDATTGYDIYMQRLNSSGAAQWTASGVPVAATTTDENAPRLLPDALSGVLMTWFDDDVYAQRVSDTGVVAWTGAKTVCIDGSVQQDQVMATDGAGGALVAWRDRRGGDDDIYAQYINWNGEPQWVVNGMAVASGTGDQRDPTIISDGAGGAIITWQNDDSPEYAIRAQRLNSAGTFLWTAGGVQLSTSGNDQTAATTVPDGQGGLVAIWLEQNLAASRDEIRAQRLNSGGNRLWGDQGLAVCSLDETANPGSLALIADSCGGVIASWREDRGSDGSYSIYAQRISLEGEAQWQSNGVEVASGLGSSARCMLVSDGACGAIVAYGDSTDLYAQRVTSAPGGAGLLPIILQ